MVSDDDPKKFQSSSNKSASVSRINRWIHFLWRSLSVFCVVFFLSILVIAYTPVGKWIATSLEKTVEMDELQPADAIVVLGGEAIRAYTAAELYFRGLAPRVLVSADSERLAPILKRCGVPEEVVEVENLPKVTADHPHTIQTLPGITPKSRLILVTSRMHPARVRMIFERSGFRNIQVFSMDSQWRPLYEGYNTIGLTGWAYMMHELGGIVKDYIRTAVCQVLI